MRVASIDIGTNSVLLLVAELRGSHLLPVCEQATITRLGQGVDATGELAPEAVQRTLGCLADCARQIGALGVDRVAAVATSAMRDARGAEHFLGRAEAILGVRPEVISGEAEALLTFDGALVGLEPEGPLAVFDVGGGSTEIIVGARVGRGGGTLSHAVSLDVGSVRLTERLIHCDPPDEAELLAVRAAVRQALRAAPSMRGRPLVGVAGTVTTLSAYVHHAVPYDPRKVHGSVLAREALSEAIATLARMSNAERRQLAAIDPRRADVIVAGALIVDEICAAADVERIIVSDRGVRWGLARKLTRLEPAR